MRPGDDPVRGEVVGIRKRFAGDRFRLLDAIRDAVALRIGDRLVLGVELELDLRLHVGRARPAHQRLDRTRNLGRVFQHPLVIFRPPRLGRRTGRKIDARGHGVLYLLWDTELEGFGLRVEQSGQRVSCPLPASISDRCGSFNGDARLWHRSRQTIGS